MRARYYSPEMRRFVNADIVAGQISNAVTMNRFAYANGNPVSFVDPFGLWSLKGAWNSFTNWVEEKIVAPIVDVAVTVGTAVADTTVPIGKTIASTAVTVGNVIADTAVTVGNTIVNTATKVGTTVKNGYNTAKDAVVNTAQTASKWVDDNVVEPVSNAATAVGDWLEDAGEWLNENAKNKDGSYSLYDNQRFNKDAVFHEQILAFTPSGPSWDPTEKNFGLGSLSVDAMTGGWEWEHADLSLLDFGHAEAGVELKNKRLSASAFASIWSPSFSFDVFGITFEIGAEVGSIGGTTKGSFSTGFDGFEIGLSIGFGLTIGASW